MLRNKKHTEAGRSMFLSSANGLANVLAVVVTFVGAPPFWAKTIGIVDRFAEHHYGPGWEEPVGFGWGVTCALLVFFLARMSLSTLIVMGALAIATKLF